MADTIEALVSDTLQERLGDRSGRVDQAWLRKAADLTGKRHDRYKTAIEYYDGEQNVKLTDRQKQYLDRSNIGYSENFCATVVDALAERLQVVGVTTDQEVEDEETGDKEDTLAEWMWEQWDANRGDELQSTVHTETTKMGDGIVMVDFDEEKGRPRLTFNSASVCKPVYEDNHLAYVVKVWNSTAKSPTNPNGREVRRMNLYYPDRVEKWFTLGAEEGANWVEWLDEGDKVWPTPWMDGKNEPLGLAAFHFANNAATDKFGRPEHWGTIPQQDRLNKELLDLASVMDSQGFPQRYAIGVANTDGLTSDPGTIWSTDNPQASFGTFSAADPGGLLRAVESTLIRIATRSRTPAHLIYISGGLPSGESLKTAEAGLVAKAKKRQIYHGGVWAEVFRSMALVADAFGAPGERPPLSAEKLKEVSINVKWQDPETRNEKEHLDALTVMSALGVSQETILSMIPGVDPSEEREKKQRAMPDIADAGVALMNAATNPPNTLPEEGAPPVPPTNRQPVPAAFRRPPPRPPVQ